MKNARLMRQFLALLVPMVLTAGGTGEVRFTTLQRDQAPFQDSITCLLQDRTGFVWLGGLNGLYRFDGRIFKPFKPLRNTNQGILHNLVLDLFEDRDGKIWISTQGGVSCYDPAQQTFQQFTHDPEDSGSLPDNRTDAVMQDAAGRMWMATSNGVGVLEASGKVRRFQHRPDDPNSLQDDRALSLAPHPDGDVWIGTRKGLCRYRSDVDRMERIAELTEAAVKTLYVEPNRVLWIGTEKAGLFRLQESAGAYTVKRYPLPVRRTAAILSIARDRDGILWVGTDGQGLHELRDEEQGTFRNYRVHEEAIFGPADNRILDLMSDRSGLLWVGTFNGVNQVNLNTRTFHHLDHNLGLSDPRIWSIYRESEEKLWVGTWNGLNLVTPKGARPFALNSANPKAPAHPAILALTADNQGRMWIGTRNGLYCLEKNGRVKAYRHDPADANTLIHNEVFSLALDRFGDLWITTAGGLIHLNLESNAFTPVALDSGGLTSLFRDSAGTLWLGTGTGLYRLVQTARGALPRMVPYQRTAHTPGMMDNYIVSLSEDNKGRLLVGTMYGLSILKFVGETIEEAQHFTKEDGLSDNIIYGVLCDNSGRIWASTGTGLNRIEENGTIRTYDAREGLVCREYNQFAYFKDSQGFLYFGGDKGLEYFLPENLVATNKPPPVALTSFQKAFEEVDLPIAISHARRVSVAMRDKYLTFSFAALDYRDPRKNRYAYMLQGNDTNWIEAGHTNTATYTNLDAGTYTFRVRAAGHEGIWNTNGTALTLVVVPPFYLTLWFKGLCLILLTCLLYSGHRLRLATLKRQKNRLQQEVAARTHELRQEKELLEQITSAVRAINKEVRFITLFEAILKETRHLGADTSEILVLNPETMNFHVMSAIPPGTHVPHKGVDRDTLVDRYLTDVKEVAPNIYQGPGTLVQHIHIDDRGEGYLIYRKTSGNFTENDVRFLENLEAHLLSAFLKNRLLRELRIVNEKKNEFMGMAAHDLRGPLGSILSYADIIYHDLKDISAVADQTKEDLLMMQRSAARILGLLNELLDISAIESGKLELKQARLDLREMLDEAHRLFLRAATEKGIDLQVEHLSASPKIMGDRTRLFQVLENLISNAVKFTDRGGLVRISYTQQDNELVVHVRDTGQGIAEDELSHIFTRFRRLGSQPTGGETSTGLGLAIARKVIEMHQGRIWVKSRRMQGTTFSFTLPPADDGRGPIR